MTDKFVFDTNCLISAALLRNSVSAKALDRALKIGRIIISEPVLHEFEEVIFRQKFDKYFFDDQERIKAISTIESNALVYFPQITINDCRDPKGNKFLELALEAEATAIVSGDQDLLILTPFNNIVIFSPADFLKAF